jgi:PAS domain-containing protein
VLGFTFVLLHRTNKIVTIQKAKIQESENQFRKMFLNHSASMLIIEPGSGQILDANRAASQLHGYSIEKLKL